MLVSFCIHKRLKSWLSPLNDNGFLWHLHLTCYLLNVSSIVMEISCYITNSLRVKVVLFRYYLIMAQEFIQVWCVKCPNVQIKGFNDMVILFIQENLILIWTLNTNVCTLLVISIVHCFENRCYKERFNIYGNFSEFNMLLKGLVKSSAKVLEPAFRNSFTIRFSLF